MEAQKVISGLSRGWCSLPHLLLVVLLGAVFFLPFLGHTPLFDWDEINFAECAREMLLTRNYLQIQINFEPFWEKPPLFIWMQAISFWLLGVNEYAARLPNAIAGIVTLLTIFAIARRHFDAATGWLWVLFFLGSFLPHFYFKSGIIDPWFNYFIFVGCYSSWRSFSGGGKWLLLSGVSFGLAVLTKGPVGGLIGGSTMFLFWLYYHFLQKTTFRFPLLKMAAVAALAVMVAAIWFGVDIYKNGWWFTSTFVQYQWRLFTTQDAGHGGPFFYHAVVLLVGCFPASAFLFQQNKTPLNAEQAQFKTLLLILGCFTLLLFSIVKTKIVHYSSLCYFPITALAAVGLYNNAVLSKRTKTLLLSIGGLWATAFILAPVAGKFLPVLSSYIAIKDEFAKANMQAETQWTVWHFLPAFFVAIAVYQLYQNKIKKGLLTLSVGIFFALVLIVSNIEKISQHAAIAFYKEIAGQDFYVQTYGYKSYAHLFYAKTKTKQPLAEEMLQDSSSQKKYLVAKVDKLKTLNTEKFRVLYSQNGFVFLESIP